MHTKLNGNTILKLLLNGSLLFALLFPLIIQAEPGVVEQLENEVQLHESWLNSFPEARPLFSGLDVPVKKLKRALHQEVDVKPQQTSYWSYFTLGVLYEKVSKGGGADYFEILDEYTVGDIAKSWLLSQAFSRLNLVDQENYYLKRTIKYSLLRGYTRLPSLAKLSLYKAKQNLLQGHYILCGHYLQVTSSLDPVCPWVPLYQLELEIKSRHFWDWSLFKIGHCLLETTGLVLQQSNLMPFLANCFRAARVFSLIFFVGFVFILFCRYISKALHGAAEKLPREIPIATRLAVIVIFILCLPVIGVGLVTFSLFLLLLLWKLLNSSEKLVAKLYMSFLFLLPGFYFLENNSLLIFDEESVYSQYYRAITYGPDKALFKSLKTYSTGSDQESLVQNAALSILHRKNGDYGSSLKFALKAKSYSPGSALAANNLANSRFLLSEFSAAKKQYMTALQKYESSPQILFNLSQVELFLNNLPQHQAYLEQAIDRGKNTVSNYIGLNDKHFYTDIGGQAKSWPVLRKTMELPVHNLDMLLSRTNLLKKSLSWRLGTGTLEIPVILIPPAIIVFILIQLFMSSGYGAGFAWRPVFICKLCLKPICNLCRSGAYCNNCFHELRGVSVEKVRDKIVQGIETKSLLFKKYTALILTVILPGSGSMYLFPVSRAFALFCFTAFLWSIYFVLGSLVKEYPDFALGFYQDLVLPVLFLTHLISTLLFIRNWRKGKLKMLEIL